MNRLSLCVLLLTLLFSGQALAAEIGGYIDIKGDYDRSKALMVGYARYQPGRTQGTIFATCRCGEASYKTEREYAVKYQKVLIAWPEPGRCMYRCINLKPGIYNICVKLGNLLTSKTITVPSEKFTASANLTLNAGRTGSLEVALPSKEMYRIVVWPAWNTNQLDWTKETVPGGVGVDGKSEPGATKIVVNGRSEGKYNVVLYKVTYLQPSPDYRREKRVKQWIVDVKAGKLTVVKG